ncbi:MAG: glutamate 5-kinase [SAR202 cluster bacterium]|nr:glutamate 5-kinase [SAR202 cluster bacterium]
MDIAEQNNTSASMSPNGVAALRYKRVVVKAGTSVLTGGSDMLHLPTVSGLVDQIAAIHDLGAEVMLVTSGAIAAGRKPLGVKSDLPNVNFRQVLAAVGQNRLMHAYSLLFEPKGINIAQVLLTWDDLADVEHSRNVHRTLDSLLELRVVPVINENDVVAVEEIGEVFGDNDMLSAMVAKLMKADLLVILTDADGLMTADPRIDSKAKRIPRVDNIDGQVESLAGKKLNPWSRGGMKTKVEAARLATSAGVTVVVCDGRRPNVVGRVEAGEDVGTLFAAGRV